MNLDYLNILNVIRASAHQHMQLENLHLLHEFYFCYLKTDKPEDNTIVLLQL